MEYHTENKKNRTVLNFFKQPLPISQNMFYLNLEPGDLTLMIF